MHNLPEQKELDIDQVIRLTKDPSSLAMPLYMTEVYEDVRSRITTNTQMARLLECDEDTAASVCALLQTMCMAHANATVAAYVQLGKTSEEDRSMEVLSHTSMFYGRLLMSIFV